METGQLWRQYAIAGIANIAIASTGYSMGWTSPINVKLSSTELSPLPEPVTTDQTSWIGSLLTVGAIFANIAIASTGYSMGWTSPINVKLNSTELSPLPEPVTTDQTSWIGSLLTVGAIFANIAIASTGYSMGWTSPINVKLNSTELSPLPEPVTTDQTSWIGSLLTVGAIFANIAIASTGYSMGWTSPINVKLNSTELSPLPEPVTTDQTSWIGSLLTVGAIFGPFLGGFAASKVGRKWGLLSTVIPLFAGWILIAAAQSVGMIYAGRICWGLAVGMLFTISPMYCAEIATDETRGALGSFLQAFITLGFLLVYGIGPYISYSAVAYVGVGFVAVFTVTFFFMPESPTYYLTKNDTESAAACLATIRGKSRAGVQAELDKMQAEVSESMTKSATIGDIFRGGNFKAFYISCALVTFQQLSGINAVLFYMTNIFEASGTSLDSAVATIIIGAIQVVASAITPLVVDRLGRRLLLLVSAAGTAIGLGLLGMYFILADNQSPIATKIGFLPILALVLFIVTYCWGLGPLPWAVMGELFPIEVKALASPIATAYCWALSFLVTRYFNPIADAIGMGTAFLIFAVCCVVAFFFTLFLVPETKGKSFQEIQEMLAGKPTKSEKV